MKTHQLPKIVSRPKKRIGRGMGSGKGSHTSSRGQKGQKTRDKIALTFEGTKIKKSLLKRLPVLRGKGKFKTLTTKAVTLKLLNINTLPSGTQINLEVLKKNGILDKNVSKAKIIDGGDVKHPYKVFVPVSAGARVKIEKAGGEIL
jgi:large subunit ribosomal protein L15